MKKTLLTLTCVAALALSACNRPLTDQEKTIVGGVAGIGAGLITANAIGANKNWTVLTTLAGAAAGIMVARNQHTNQCAYSNGDGTYRTAPCPV
ncbi:glucose-6-phosphate isomerase [Aliiroseovarius sediminis]|uniref:glucose-6-phosphate isomerase n=1 Tax=Aliiroseovarius sediminis TaxID=2925839 RepID=UPI001F5A8838|nr:glucose-6-phosphate isomerase [Aliiroseovarius sediminis]MCI2394004.1 glucose-6-phosphate isomerase [Aliiroseovarius sediminis]